MSPRERREQLRTAASRVLAVVQHTSLMKHLREHIWDQRYYELLESALERLELAASEAENHG